MLGTSLQHYQITSKLGQGGMGEVYRATDTKLDREVAIKVLPAAVSGDRERLARFEREAKVLAQLSHANVASVFGFDQDAGTWFLVMECVAGEDLAERLKRGALSVDESLAVGRQIAEALEAAHECGIIHRDLKPANIKLMPDGRVKVLDFGLAKALGGDFDEVGRASLRAGAAARDGSRGRSLHQGELTRDESATLTDVFTKPGTVLGTAAYMSPEQAKGQVLDQRTDVWAFGCVLFECLTGKLAFGGGDSTEMLAAIIKGEPDWGALPPAVPASLKHLLRKCLNKDRRHRLHEIADARIDLELAQAAFSDSSVAEVKASTPGLRVHPAVAMVGAVVLLMLGLVLGRGLGPESATTGDPVRKVNVALVKDGYLSLESGSAIQVSPDGTTVGFIVFSKDQRRLMIRRLDQLDAVELVEAQGADQFCFSPDGRSIAFTGERMGFLQTVTLTGGTVRKLCPVYRPRGLDWAGDWIYFAYGRADGISRVPETGGEPELLTQLSGDEATHRWPHVLPGGKAMLYTSQTPPFDNDESKLMVLPLEGGEPRLVRAGGHDARYVAATRSLLFAHRGNLMAGRFDLDSLTLETEPLPLIDQVATSNNAAVHAAASSDGSLFYIAGGLYGADTPLQFTWVDRAGTSEALPLPAAYYSDYFRISPSGEHLVFGRKDGDDTHLWLYDLRQGGEPRRVSLQTGINLWPIWSPSGGTIVYHSWANGGLVARRMNGIGGEQLLLTSAGDGNAKIPTSWIRDGRAFYFRSAGSGSDFMGVMELSGSDEEGWHSNGTSRLELDRYHGKSLTVSSNDRWLAYNSKEMRSQVVVESRGSQQGFWFVSAGGRQLNSPRWSSAGPELLFGARQSRMGSWLLFSSRFRDGDGAFESEEPIQWPGVVMDDSDQYDMDPDGSRVLILTPAEGESVDQPVNEVILFDRFSSYLSERLSEATQKP